MGFYQLLVDPVPGTGTSLWLLLILFGVLLFGGLGAVSAIVGVISRRHDSR
jgi:uncharacterized membrane protein YesL